VRPTVALNRNWALFLFSVTGGLSFNFQNCVPLVFFFFFFQYNERLMGFVPSNLGTHLPSLTRMRLVQFGHVWYLIIYFQKENSYMRLVKKCFFFQKKKIIIIIIIIYRPPKSNFRVK
jgi:hypothetical protein